MKIKSPMLIISLLTLSLTAQALEKTYVESQPFSNDDNKAFVKSVLIDKVIKRASEDAGILYLSTNKMTDDFLTSSISVISSAYVKVKESKVSFTTVKGEDHLQITALVYTDESFIKRQGTLLNKALYLTENIESSLAKIEYSQKKISKLSTERALKTLAIERKKLEQYRAALKSTIDANGLVKNNEIKSEFLVKNPAYDCREINLSDKAIVQQLANGWFDRVVDTVIKPIENGRGIEIVDVFVHEDQSVGYNYNDNDYYESESNYLYRYIKEAKNNKPRLAVSLKYVQAHNETLLNDLLTEWFVLSENRNTGNVIVQIDKKTINSKSIIEQCALYSLKEKYDKYRWNYRYYDVFLNNTYAGSINASPKKIVIKPFDHLKKKEIIKSKKSPYYHSKIIGYEKGFVWYNVKGMRFSVDGLNEGNPLRVIVKNQLN